MSKPKRPLTKTERVERKHLAFPGLLFIPETGIIWFGVPGACTIDHICLYYLPMGEDRGEIQLSFNVGDDKGHIKRTYYIKGKPGKTKAVDSINLTPDDSVTIRTDRPIAPGSSVCISYLMKVKS